MSAQSGEELATQIAGNLPALRRYARALTGTQASGDAYAAATLEAILADPSEYDATLSAKAALFRTFHAIWTSTGKPAQAAQAESGPAAAAFARLSKLTANTREALMLHTIENFPPADVARVMQIQEAEAQELINIAFNEMARMTAGRILIIEDEAIISMDLEAIVAEMGHRVTGVARTWDGAVHLAAQEPCDLILSDIQLADNSSGIDAVNDILAKHGERPVIFVTAFPERLLTGEGPEPAFLISKPYTEAEVRSAVSQAMFFSSTETLKA